MTEDSTHRERVILRRGVFGPAGILALVASYRSITSSLEVILVAPFAPSVLAKRLITWSVAQAAIAALAFWLGTRWDRKWKLDFGIVCGIGGALSLWALPKLLEAAGPNLGFSQLTQGLLFDAASFGACIVFCRCQSEVDGIRVSRIQPPGWNLAMCWTFSLAASVVLPFVFAAVYDALRPPRSDIANDLLRASWCFAAGISCIVIAARYWERWRVPLGGIFVVWGGFYLYPMSGIYPGRIVTGGLAALMPEDYLVVTVSILYLFTGVTFLVQQNRRDWATATQERQVSEDPLFMGGNILFR